MGRWGAQGRRRVLTTAAIVAVLLPCTTAAAPSSGVTSVELAAGVARDGVHVSHDGVTEVTVREVTIAPGGTTGWHYHQGPLLAVVKAGTVTEFLYDPEENRCRRVVNVRGNAFVEPHGPHHPHIGHNFGDEPVVLHASYVLPEGSPPAVRAPAPPRSARGCH